MGPLVTGVLVVLLFSVAWPIPIRSVNGLLCFGVSLGGFVAGIMHAKANGNTLEPSRGLKLGGRVGLMAALIVIAVDLLFEYVDFGQGARAGVDVLDPIPKYIYLAIYGIWDGLLDLVSRGEQADGLEWPGRIARYIILLGSTCLFAGFGGGVAASTVQSPTIDEVPESRPATPSRSGWMRQAPAIMQLQQPQEATIYKPPPGARPAVPPAAATGTYGSPAPAPGGAYGPAMRQATAAAGAYGPAMGQAPATAPAEAYGTAPGSSVPVWIPEGAMTPQPYFDEAAQQQGTRRPRAAVMLDERNPAASKESASNPS